MDARKLTGTTRDAFARHLADLGHTPLTVAAYSDGARHFGEWLYRIRVCSGSDRRWRSLPGSRATGVDARVYVGIAVFPPNTWPACPGDLFRSSSRVKEL